MLTNTQDIDIFTSHRMAPLLWDPTLASSKPTRNAHGHQTTTAQNPRDPRLHFRPIRPSESYPRMREHHQRRRQDACEIVRTARTVTFSDMSWVYRMRCDSDGSLQRRQKRCKLMIRWNEVTAKLPRITAGRLLTRTSMPYCELPTVPERAIRLHRRQSGL